jgi:hypothetical protein
MKLTNRQLGESYYNVLDDLEIHAGKLKDALTIIAQLAKAYSEAGAAEEAVDASQPPTGVKP